MAISQVHARASHSVGRVPRASRIQNVAARQPATAPSVFVAVEQRGSAAAPVGLVLDRAGGGAQRAARHEGRREQDESGEEQADAVPPKSPRATVPPTAR